MAIANVDVESGPTPASAATATWTRTIAGGLSNSFLVVAVAIATGGGAVSTSSILWDSGGANQGMTLLARYQEPTDTLVTIELWGLVAPTAGAARSFLATFSGSVIYGLGSALFTGVDQSTPWNAASPQTSNGVNPTNPSIVITSANGEYAIDVLGIDLGSLTTMTKGGSQTQIVQQSAIFGSFSLAASFQASSGSAATNSWTGTNATNKWFQVGGSLVPAGASAPPAPMDMPHSPQFQALMAQ